MIFGGKKLYPKDLCKITIELNELPQVTSARFLAIIADESLSWRENRLTGLAQK